MLAYRSCYFTIIDYKLVDIATGSPFWIATNPCIPWNNINARQGKCPLIFLKDTGGPTIDSLGDTVMDQHHDQTNHLKVPCSIASCLHVLRSKLQLDNLRQLYNLFLFKHEEFSIANTSTSGHEFFSNPSACVLFQHC